MMIIDPPLTAISTEQEIRAWIAELQAMPDQHDEAVIEAIREARRQIETRRKTVAEWNVAHPEDQKTP